MSSFQSIELYDPESPSLDDDLCHQLDRSTTCKDSESVSPVCSFEFPVNRSCEIEDAENCKFSATKDSIHSASIQCNTSVHDEQKCLSDVTPTDKHVKPELTSKSAIVWKSRKKILRPSLKEFDDVETVKGSAVKNLSLDVTPVGSNIQLLDSDNVQQLQNSQQLHDLHTVNPLRMSSISNAIIVDNVCGSSRNHGQKDVEIVNKKFINDTLQKKRTPEPDVVLNDSHTNSTVDIAEPAEPCDVDNKMTLSEQPLTIKLSRVEDLLEPDELFHTSDPNHNNEHVVCPRIIRLDREHKRDNKAHSIAHPCDINDSSEPTDNDTEPLVGEGLQISDPNSNNEHVICPRLDCEHDNKADSIAQPHDISDPSEPSDTDAEPSDDEIHQTSDPNCNNEQVMCPRIIRLHREHDYKADSMAHPCDISDPSEPTDTDIEPSDDEVPQTSDPNCNNEHMTCPRIIRLDREHHNQADSIAQPHDISDPSEPTDSDTEPPNDEIRGFIPREIKLDRVDVNSSSLTKPPFIEPSTLLAKTHTGGSNMSLVAETYPVVESDGRTDTPDTPMSPANSIKSLNDHDHEEASMPGFMLFEDNNCNGVTSVDNKCSLSRGNSMKSDQSVLNHQSLSDGEIVDEDEEEEFGIFQLSASARFNEKEKRDGKHLKKMSEKKRLYKDIDDDDVGPQRRNKADRSDHSRSNKRQKLLTDARSSYASEHHDKSTDVPVHLCDKSKETVKKQKRKEQKAEWEASRSSEKLLVGTSCTTERRVVVIRKSVDESKKENHSEHRLSPVTVADKITPKAHHDPLCEKTQKNDMMKSKERTLNKRKYTGKRHHKRHSHEKEPHAHKRKWKHRKHKHRKHLSDDDGSFDDFEQRHNRSKSRSYDHIVEMIRSDGKQSSSNVRHLRSVVVHKNTLVSARPRSSSVSSYDSHHSSESLVSTAECHNLDHREGILSGGHMHLSRLSYSGEIEQDVYNTLLAECIKSKYGPDYDINCVSRNLAHLCPSATESNDDVEIIGVSYPGEMQLRNVHNADSRERKNDHHECDNGEVVISLDEQLPLPVEGFSSPTVEEPETANLLPRNNMGSNKVESKNVTLLSKEVQTHASLFAETCDHMTESGIFSDSTKNKLHCGHGKADKELQVSDFDDEEECIQTVSSYASVGCNTELSEVVNGIQSPENYAEESSCVPRPVLLNRAEDPEPTPDPPQQDFNKLHFALPNVPKSLSVTRTIVLESVEESADEIFPLVAASVSRVSPTWRSAVADTEHFSVDNTDAVIVSTGADNQEQCQLSDVSTAVNAPAFHQLPPVVKYKPIQYKHTVPSHVVNPSFSEKLTATSSIHGSTVHVPGMSAVQQLQSEPVATMNLCMTSQPPLISKSLSVDDKLSAAAVMGGGSYSHVQRENQNIRCSSELPESDSFFTSVKSVHIPGICEDVVESRRPTSLSPHQGSLLSGSFLQTAGSFGVAVTSSTATISETPQQAVAAGDTVTSHLGTRSDIPADSLHLSSNQEGSMKTTATTSTDNSVLKQPVAPGLLPLLSSIATCLFKTSLQTAAVPASSSVESDVITNSIIPSVSNRRPSVTPLALKHASTSISSTDAVNAWVTSLPVTTAAMKPQPSSRPLPKPCAEIDFDVDAVESPRSDEIMSFSPPASEHMMAIIKMKHTVGLKNDASRKATDNAKNANKRVRFQFFLDECMEYHYVWFDCINYLNVFVMPVYCNTCI